MAIKVDRPLTKMALQRMRKVGLVDTVGIGSGTKYRLPRTSAKEEP